MTIHLYKHGDGKLVQIWYDPHVRSWFGQWCTALPCTEELYTYEYVLRQFSPKFCRNKYAKHGMFQSKHFELLDDGTESVIEYRRETVESCFQLDRKANYCGKLNNGNWSEVCS